MLKKLTRIISGAVLFLPTSSGIAGMAFAENTQIEVTEKTCQKVHRHLARQDVTYKPGVDVRGRAVVPADVSGSQLALPDSIVLDISIPLKDLYSDDHPPPTTLQNAEVEVGKLEYNLSSGKLLFNKQELSQAALLEVGDKCYEVFETAQ